MRNPGTNEWFPPITAGGEWALSHQLAGAGALPIPSVPFGSLVRPGGPFYNPSNNASGAVVTLSSLSRADNRNTQYGCRSASECLNIDFHLEFSQEH
jgi:hypothetical protein